jgi:hypothetical protein
MRRQKRIDSLVMMSVLALAVTLSGCSILPFRVAIQTVAPAGATTTIAATGSPQPSQTSAPQATATATPTSTPKPTPTVAPSVTAAPTKTKTQTLAPTVTAAPTSKPTALPPQDTTKLALTLPFLCSTDISLFDRDVFAFTGASDAETGIMYGISATVGTKIVPPVDFDSVTIKYTASNSAAKGGLYFIFKSASLYGNTAKDIVMYLPGATLSASIDLINQKERTFTNQEIGRNTILATIATLTNFDDKRFNVVIAGHMPDNSSLVDLSIATYWVNGAPACEPVP